FFFFFQAEDGIRDIGVTGVQTCALPISQPSWASARPSVDSATTRVPSVALLQSRKRRCWRRPRRVSRASYAAPNSASADHTRQPARLPATSATPQPNRALRRVVIALLLRWEPPEA